MKIVRVIFAALVCAASVCWAQNESLLIGPGDLLHIQVLEAADLTQTVRVMDSGEVPLIIGGNVKVAGLTPQAAAEVIQTDLKEKKYLVDPHVSVSIEQYTAQDVTILGEVKAPGRYSIQTPLPVLSALAQAHGLGEMADRNIIIQRRNSDQRVKYFVSNDPEQALNSPMVVYPGDTILVPKVKIVYVIGDVTRPGGYPMTANDSTLTALEAVSLAGSWQLHARQSHTRIIRKQPNGTYIEMQVSLSDMVKGKRSDLPLEANDIIYVPFSYLKNFALETANIVSAASAAAIYTSTRR
jgi:polysaccharide biosynthesis/export protein